MDIRFLAIQGPILITPVRRSDDRGWFMESWSKVSLEQNGINLSEFVQDNHSFSEHRHTLRGLHYQSPPAAQDKLVRCVKGAILDVAVDVPKG